MELADAAPVVDLASRQAMERQDDEQVAAVVPVAPASCYSSGSNWQHFEKGLTSTTTVRNNSFPGPKSQSAPFPT